MIALSAQPGNKNIVGLLWFAYLVALIVWGGLAYLEIGRLLSQGRLFALSIDGRPYVADFVIYYNAALLSQASTAGDINIYDPLVQASFVAKLISPVAAELPFYLQYPPYFFALMRPLAGVGLTVAWLVWSSLGLVAVLFGIHLVARGRLRSGFERLFLLAACLASYPAWLSFKLGQTSIFLFTLVAGFWCLMRARRYFLAGAVIGLAVVKLQYALILLVVGLVAGRLAFLGGFAATTAVHMLASIGMLGWANVAAYPAALLRGETSSGVSGVHGELMQNLRGELVLLVGADNRMVHLISLAALAVVALLVALLWLYVARRKAISDNFSFDLCSSLTTLALLASSPHTHVQDYLLAVVPCAWLYALSKNADHGSGKIKILRGLIIAFPVLSWVFYFARPVFMLLRIQPFFLWALAMIALAAPLVKRDVASTEPTPS